MLTSKVSTTPTNSNISIVPRKNKKNNKASYIFHLLNRNNDNSTDSIASKSNLRINIDSGFIKGSKIECILTDPINHLQILPQM